MSRRGRVASGREVCFAVRVSAADPETPTLALTDPIESVPGLTPAQAEAFRRIGVPSVAHLIAHLPHRHERIEPEAPIAELDEDFLVSTRGEVSATRVAGPPNRKRFQAVLIDGSGRLDLVWFNQPYLQRRIKPGDRLRVQGKTRRVGSALQIANPKWEVVRDEVGEGADTGQKGDAGGERGGVEFRPVYPATEDLPSHAIERAVKRVLDRALPLIEDHLSEGYRRERELPELASAYRMLHAPADEEEIADARRRLVYDELLLFQLGVHMRRAHVRAGSVAPRLGAGEQVRERIAARLPFELTEGQRAVVDEVLADLSEATPANRLIQGDVGSGKTVVAVYAMLASVANKHQATLMAPTEVLAEQHFASISKLLGGSGVRVELVTGATTGPEKASQLDRIAAGEVDIAIGTHALLGEKLAFRSLGVAVIDEQHRFGVHQRAVLRSKAGDERLAPHILVMTATPIPRTLSLTVFGDLDVSTVIGMPPGRSPVRTRWVTPAKRDEVYGFVRGRVEAGEQAYVVVPAVDPATAGDLSDVRTTVRRLEAGPLAGKRLAAVHGRLKRSTREAAMERFRAGRVDVLVATTVIEVGVDVPNATVMVIEQAERFGLAQLHQLRGRVGRGSKASACVLVGEPTTEEGRARLEALVQSTDGFELAEKDLELRGPGELYGSRQSGGSPFRLSEFPRDTELLLLARRDASAWIGRSPVLSGIGERLVRSRLMKAHGEALGLIDIG